MNEKKKRPAMVAPSQTNPPHFAACLQLSKEEGRRVNLSALLDATDGCGFFLDKRCNFDGVCGT